MGERIEAHGWSVKRRQDPGHRGFLVPLAQPERGLIPLLLDGQAAEPWIGAERMYPPPKWPEGKRVPLRLCRHGAESTSAFTTADRPAYDLEYDTD